MAFCATCGAQVEGRFCAKCGTPIGAAPAPPVQAGNSAPVAPAAGGLSANAASALAYVLGLITGVLFLVLAPYNQMKDVRFHAFQSIFLSVAWVAVWIAVSIVGSVLMAISFALSALVGLLSMLVGLGFLVLWIYLIIKAYQGQKVVLPVIGPLAEKQA